jgi:hypothetical protein
MTQSYFRDLGLLLHDYGIDLYNSANYLFSLLTTDTDYSDLVKRYSLDYSLILVKAWSEAGYLFKLR